MFKTIFELRRPKINPALLVAVIIAVLSARPARAGDIPGPPLPIADNGWQYSGVGFTANVNSSLTSFTFQNQGRADVVELVNPSGTVLDSVFIPSGTISDTVSVNWSLTAGNQYYLLQGTLNNGQWNYWGLPAPSDTEISMTDTGIFSNSPCCASFGISGTTYWADFNNIITTSQAAAEPSSTLLLGINLLGAALIGLGWKRKPGTSSTRRAATAA